MTSSALSPTQQRLSVYWNQGAVCLIAFVGLIGLILLRDPARLEAMGWSGLVSMGIVGLWRWAWFGLHIVRFWVYQYIVFPRIRRQANRIPFEDLPPVCLLVPTYKEKAWITERVFRSIGLEAKTLGQPVYIVTVSSGPEEDAAIVEALKLGDPDLSSIRIFHAKDPGDGKRKALADGLRYVAQLDLPKDTIIALMDGDSEFSPGTLRRCLPLFRMFPKMGALTTDEVPVVVGSYFFSEWFHLRFAQRHYQMCSISLSKKVLCLTGRFALYRAEAALHPTFAQQLENDTLDDWLWGRFKFLSGDDKSTWYWMLKQGGYDLMYVPDVIVYSIESISGSLLKRTYQNMRRWFGNMLRNGNRALALGPNRLGFFVWLCLVDQRVSMWTSLISPCLLLIALFSAQWLAAGLLVSWLLLSRAITLTIIFWGRESHLKPIHFLILVLSQWSSGVIKIWTQMNLSKQRWFNRGDRKLNVGGSPLVQFITENTSRFLLGTQTFTFGVILFSLLGLLNPMEDTVGLWYRHKLVADSPAQVFQAIDYDVVPSDGQDDAIALQTLINSLPDQGEVQIVLPIGEIDLFHPLEINRSNTSIYGQGAERTILLARFDQANHQFKQAVISVQPSDGLIGVQSPTQLVKDSASKLQNIQLKRFTLYSTPGRSATLTFAPDGIVIRAVTQSSVENLQLKLNSRYALVIDSSTDTTVRYISVEGALEPEKIKLVNSTNVLVQGLPDAKTVTAQALADE